MGFRTPIFFTLNGIFSSGRVSAPNPDVRSSNPDVPRCNFDFSLETENFQKFPKIEEIWKVGWCQNFREF